MRARTARRIRQNLRFFLHRSLVLFLALAGLFLLLALTLATWHALEATR